MGKPPKQRRGWSDVGVRLGESLSNAGSGGGHNSHVRRLITAPRGSGGSPRPTTDAPAEVHVSDSDDSTATLVLPDGHLWAVQMHLEFGATVTAPGDSRVIRAAVQCLAVGAWGSLAQDLLPGPYVGSHTAIGSPGASVDMDGVVPLAGWAQGSFTASCGTAAPGATAVTSGYQMLYVAAHWLRALTEDELPT